MFEKRTAVEADKLLAIERELDYHEASGLLAVDILRDARVVLAVGDF